jgi:hypothetical protein
VLYWQVVELGVQCEVIAPTLVPVRAGDRVKTDRREAAKLARSYRSGDLTAVWVPDGYSEGLRDLVRSREAAKQDQPRARHRLSIPIRLPVSANPVHLDVKRHLGQMLRKPVAGMATQVVNGKGDSHQESGAPICVCSLTGLGSKSS